MDYIALAFSLMGIILNANKRWEGWLFYIMSNFLWIIYFIPRGETSTLILWTVFLLFNIYGLYQWTKNPKES